MFRIISFCQYYKIDVFKFSEELDLLNICQEPYNKTIHVFSELIYPKSYYINSHAKFTDYSNSYWNWLLNTISIERNDFVETCRLCFDWSLTSHTMVAYWGFKPMNTRNRKVHLQVVTILLDVSTYPNSFHCAKSQQLRARASFLFRISRYPIWPVLYHNQTTINKEIQFRYFMRE